MKKFKFTTATIIALCAVNSFASSIPQNSESSINVHKLECHCEKHQMIFELKNGESVTEMSKHCTMNIDKKNSMVKFLDDNSGQTVKCSISNGKLEIDTCKPFKHNKTQYTRSTTLNESEYNQISSH